MLTEGRGHLRKNPRWSWYSEYDSHERIHLSFYYFQCVPYSRQISIWPYRTSMGISCEDERSFYNCIGTKFSFIVREYEELVDYIKYIITS